MIRYLPFLFASALCLVVLIPSVSSRADALLSRLALALFGEYVATSHKKQQQRKLMHAAHIAETHRQYASRTLLYSAILGVAGGILGVYFATFVFWVLEVGDEPLANALPAMFWSVAALFQLESLSLSQIFVLFVAASSVGGVVLGIGSYWLRWYILREKAHARASEIEATLPQTIAFIYALSRSGMSFPAILSTLSDNQAVYGEAAKEFSVVVNDMDTFGTDVITALTQLSERTPSDGMADLSENLASVLGSGKNVSGFLHEQYIQYKDESESQQRQYLDLLATFAEAYVTVLVAGPLFLITILVVIGLVLEDTLSLVRAISYIGLPLGTIAFVVYVDSITQSFQSGAKTSDASTTGNSISTDTATLSGTDSDEQQIVNQERLAAYDRIKTILQWANQPKDAVLSAPWTTAIVTVPFSIIWITFRVDSFFLPLPELGAAIAGPVVEAAIITLGMYAIVYELGKRRTKRIESQMPDFLDRFASVNDAGMTVIESFKRVANSDLGVLTHELQRTWNDIQWGATTQDALTRFDARTRSPAVTRSVALISNAMRTSGDVGPVVSIAADQSRSSAQLERERSQEMLTYLIVIYISFLVFLGIIAALSVSFIPAIEAAAGEAATDDLPVGVGFAPTLGDINAEAYLIVFYHVSAIQGLCSGLVAGQLGEGRVHDGVKHATILLVLTYVTFLFIG